MSTTGTDDTDGTSSSDGASAGLPKEPWKVLVNAKRDASGEWVSTGEEIGYVKLNVMTPTVNHSRTSIHHLAARLLGLNGSAGFMLEKTDALDGFTIDLDQRSTSYFDAFVESTLPWPVFEHNVRQARFQIQDVMGDVHLAFQNKSGTKQIVFESGDVGGITGQVQLENAKTSSSDSGGGGGGGDGGGVSLPEEPWLIRVNAAQPGTRPTPCHHAPR